MFDIAPSELMLVAIVALVVIGPKDLPRAMRFVGQWVGRARGVARHFRSGFDEMVRQAELDEMEKKWASENARIMAEHPTVTPPEEHDDAHYAMTPLPELPAPHVGETYADEVHGGGVHEADAVAVKTDGQQEPPAKS
jgi:sec-independent protein translocase protein TatB